MPKRVRIKLAIIIAIAGLVAAYITLRNPWYGVLFILAGLLYVEMIYPKWNLFGEAVLNVKDKGPNAVALTFDDGPSEWTLPILETLKKENVKATFFLLGENIERHPRIAKKIQKEGHAIGYHGHTHTKFHFKDPMFIRWDLNRCQKAFMAAGIELPTIIRLPHGFKNLFAVREIKKRGLKLCAWGRGVWDSKRPGVHKIVERSLQTKPGEILLLHDGQGVKKYPDRSQTAEAVGPIIKGLKEKGFEFVTLS